MYRLDKQQEKIMDNLSRIAREEIAPWASEVDSAGEFPRQAVAALAREGFLGLTVPAEYGGMGQDIRTLCAALEKVAECCASTGMIYLMHLSALAAYLNRPESTAEYLRSAAVGRHLATLAFSEKGSRSHFWAPVSRAVANAEGVYINAEKSWVTSAGHANGYVISTGWAEAEAPLQSMLYLVLDTDPGLSVSGTFQGLGLRGNASCPMTLNGVQIDHRRALSDGGKGMEVMLGAVLPVFSAGAAAVSIGIAEAAVQSTQQHLSAVRFEHTGERLADLPVLRARLAGLRIETDRARSHLVSVIDSLEHPGEHTQLNVLGIKASAAEAVIRVTDEAMRACGGAAYSRQLGVERNFRDARASSVMAPTTDHAHDFIGRMMCGLDLF